MQVFVRFIPERRKKGGDHAVCFTFSKKIGTWYMSNENTRLDGILVDDKRCCTPSPEEKYSTYTTEFYSLVLSRRLSKIDIITSTEDQRTRIYTNTQPIIQLVVDSKLRSIVRNFSFNGNILH
jgi:hypothetical protein